MPAGFCSVKSPLASVAAWATIALSLALFRQTTEALARGSPSWLQTMPERGDWAKVTVDMRQRHVAERITLSLHLIVHLNIDALIYTRLSEKNIAPAADILR